jgi:hypothetical protein
MGKIGELERESGKEQTHKTTPNVFSKSAPSGPNIYPPWRSVVFEHL